MKLLKVEFKQDILDVIENGKQWISVNVICKNLGLHRPTQQDKLKSDPTFEAKLIKVNTRGGIQEVFCIPLNKLNGWLFSINPNRVKPEVREKLIAYKNECFEVLYNHFNHKKTYIYNHIKQELETKLIEKENLIFMLQDEIYYLKNRNKNLVRALNTLTQQKEEVSQGALARFGNNALEAIFQIEQIQKEFEEIKKKIDTRLNRVEIFKQNIEKVMPKPALVGINKKGEKEYVEIPLSQLKK